MASNYTVEMSRANRRAISSEAVSRRARVESMTRNPRPAPSARPAQLTQPARPQPARQVVDIEEMPAESSPYLSERTKTVCTRLLCMFPFALIVLFAALFGWAFTEWKAAAHCHTTIQYNISCRQSSEMCVRIDPMKQTAVSYFTFSASASHPCRAYYNYPTYAHNHNFGGRQLQSLPESSSGSSSSGSGPDDDSSELKEYSLELGRSEEVSNLQFA